MPKLEYFIVCRDVLANLETDEITLSHVLEDVFPNYFPYVIGKATSVSVWNIEPQELKVEYQATLVVKVPGHADAPFPMNLAKRRRRYRAIQSVIDIPINEPGEIGFEVLLNGEHAASHILTVHPIGDAKAEPGIPILPPK